jgi:outer membrane receptor protein involved in Fe transport
VIDFVRATDADLWMATNLRDVTSTGVEASIARRWHGAMVRAYYAGLHIDAPALTLESKYVLEYARHQTGGSLTVPIADGFRGALNFDHRHRVDGQSYNLVSMKVSRAFSRVDLFVAGTNLLNETYHEIDGVDMPGRWMTVGLDLR